LTDEQRIAAIKAAIENGCNYFNASEFYGNIEGDNTLTLLRKYFDLYPEDADKVVINVKGCYGQTGPNASKEATKQSIERSLAALGPRARIAEFEPARRDPNADYLNDTLATIDTYVQSGKIGAISVSELGLETFTKVVEQYKIQSLEIELSLFRTDPITNGLLEACAKHGVTVLAYSTCSLDSLTIRHDSPPNSMYANRFHRRPPGQRFPHWRLQEARGPT
jgi:pyridoxine 4-dehydrogenase